MLAVGISTMLRLAIISTEPTKAPTTTLVIPNTTALIDEFSAIL